VQENLRLREVTMKDAPQLYTWAMLPETRLNAIQTESFTYENHVKWLQQKLKDEQCKFYMAMLNGITIGQIRLDITENIALIDYTVDENQRGKGFGKVIVNLAVQNNTHLGFEAWVLDTNIASQKCFEALGFTLQKTVNLDNRIFKIYRKG
jgi:RimJ/RimL family protein N-acetyltransferase